jgi:hypothetical protein
MPEQATKAQHTITTQQHLATAVEGVAEGLSGW